MSIRPSRLFLALACVALVAATKVDDDLLPAKSRWSGTEGADESHARSRPRAAHLKVTTRDAKTFVAEYTLGGVGGVELKGTVEADGTIDCVPAKILKGDWNRNILVDHWRGKATKDALTLTRKLTAANGGEKTVELTPAKGKGKDD